MGYQMLTLTIGWQIYELTNSAFDLGLVGLIQFVPAVVLTLLIGHAADRYDRRIDCPRGALRLRAGRRHDHDGAAHRNARPRICCSPRCSSSVAHARSRCRPRMRLRPLWSHHLDLACDCRLDFGEPDSCDLRARARWTHLCDKPSADRLHLSDLLRLLDHVGYFGHGPAGRHRRANRRHSRSVLAGFHYIRSRRRLLGVITLDLFVVILGGATALLPVYARDILAVGPIGLGLLRSAPAVGALITRLYWPVTQSSGISATKCSRWSEFSVSQRLSSDCRTRFRFRCWRSLILGASDAVSIVIRFSLVQIETPDEKRGRVSAINYLFVGSSNTLGEFEFRSGRRLAWGGTVRGDRRARLPSGRRDLDDAISGSASDRPLRTGRSETNEGVMHILITGAAGMIGRKLSARLVKDGQLNGQKIDRLTLIDVVAPEKPAGFAGIAELSASDLSSPGTAAKAVAGKPDVIFHLAGVVSGEAETDFDKGYRVNLDGTRAHCSRKFGPPVANRRSCSLHQLRCMARHFPLRLPTSFTSRPSHPTVRKRRSANCCSPTTTGASILEGVGIRLPTICVRPGKPNKAASGFFSGIIREPLAGQEALLPVSESVRHTHASPRAAVGFLIHAAGLTREQLGPRINLAMPGVSCTVGEQIDALRRVAGDKVAARIRRAPDELVQQIVSGWAERLDAKRASDLGFQGRGEL